MMMNIKLPNFNRLAEQFLMFFFYFFIEISHQHTHTQSERIHSYLNEQSIRAFSQTIASIGLIIINDVVKLIIMSNKNLIEKDLNRNP